MLDQRLLRDNPDQIASQLARRGLTIDLTGLQAIARLERDLEDQRSQLQAEGNQIGRQVGQLIQGGGDPKGAEVLALRQRGNAIKQEVAGIEEQEKALEQQLRDALIALPNLPGPEVPEGASEADNLEVKRWGSQLKAPAR